MLTHNIFLFLCSEDKRKTMQIIKEIDIAVEPLA